jgi:hypothetical protein
MPDQEALTKAESDWLRLTKWIQQNPEALTNPRARGGFTAIMQSYKQRYDVATAARNYAIQIENQRLARSAKDYQDSADGRRRESFFKRLDDLTKIDAGAAQSVADLAWEKDDSGHDIPTALHWAALSEAQNKVNKDRVEAKEMVSLSNANQQYFSQRSKVDTMIRDLPDLAALDKDRNDINQHQRQLIVKDLRRALEDEDKLRALAGVAIDHADKIKVINPDGQTKLIPRGQLPNAILYGTEDKRYTMPADPFAYKITAPPVTIPVAPWQMPDDETKSGSDQGSGQNP